MEEPNKSIKHVQQWQKSLRVCIRWGQLAGIDLREMKRPDIWNYAGMEAKATNQGSN
jgi:hypothetical protein